MSVSITNGSKLISRLDREIGVLIDNCLGFLYAIDLDSRLRREVGRIEAVLYDRVYMGRTPAGCAFKEDLFRTRILPIMKRLAPSGYYFGIDPDAVGLLGYWPRPAVPAAVDTVGPPGEIPSVPADASVAD